MKRVRRPIGVLGPVLLLLAPGCSSPSDDPTALTQGEAQALNDAAATLDANAVDANVFVANDASPTS